MTPTKEDQILSQLQQLTEGQQQLFEGQKLLMEGMQQLRQEMNQRFEEQDQKLTKLIQEQGQRFNALFDVSDAMVDVILERTERMGQAMRELNLEVMEYTHRTEFVLLKVEQVRDHLMYRKPAALSALRQVPDSPSK